MATAPAAPSTPTDSVPAKTYKMVDPTVGNESRVLVTFEDDAGVRKHVPAIVAALTSGIGTTKCFPPLDVSVSGYPTVLGETRSIHMPWMQKVSFSNVRLVRLDKRRWKCFFDATYTAKPQEARFAKELHTIPYDLLVSSITCSVPDYLFMDAGGNVFETHIRGGTSFLAFPKHLTDDVEVTVRSSCVFETRYETKTDMDLESLPEILLTPQGAL